MANSTYGYNALDNHYHIPSLWYLGKSSGNQVHYFDWGILKWGRLPVGFYTLILFIIKWQNLLLPCHSSVLPFHISLLDSSSVEGLISQPISDNSLNCEKYEDDFMVYSRH